MHLFTYGSLMSAVVWRRVVMGAYASCPGTLRGFARWRIRGEVYPALLPAPPESLVAGVLYEDVSEADVAALDRFEGEGTDYRRVEVTVVLADGRTVPAWTYLYLHPDRVEPVTWEPERFAGEGLGRFLDTYCQRRLLEPDSTG